MLVIADGLDRTGPMEFGELGFDIGVDLDRKIWMIEVNPKPNWNLPEGSEKSLLEQKMALHLLGYCRYLLKINVHEPVIGYTIDCSLVI